MCWFGAGGTDVGDATGSAPRTAHSIARATATLRSPSHTTRLVSNRRRAAVVGSVVAATVFGRRSRRRRR